MALVISRREVESLLEMKDCIDAVEKAFRELAEGRAVMPQRAVIPVTEKKGVFLGMPAFIGGDMDALGLKLVTVYPENPAKHDLPTVLGTLLLCDPATGKAEAIMDAEQRFMNVLELKFRRGHSFYDKAVRFFIILWVSCMKRLERSLRPRRR